jgi:hypothetical protein
VERHCSQKQSFVVPAAFHGAPQVRAAGRSSTSEPAGTFVSGFLEGLTGRPRARNGISGENRYWKADIPDDSSVDIQVGNASDPDLTLPEENSDGLRAAAARYPLLSAPLLLSIPASGLIAYLIFQHPMYAWVNAIGLLIVPFSIFCWIFTTIRGIHLVGVRFWFIPSTYVALVGGVIAFLLCMIVSISTHEAARHGRQEADVTLYVTAAILYGGCTVWNASRSSTESCSVADAEG